nr:protein FAM219B [Anser cygnoides]
MGKIEVFDPPPGPQSAHRELCRIRPQLSPFPFQPPRGESRRPSARGSDGAERRGPYLLCRPPAGHAKLQRPREPAKAAPRWHGLLGGPPAKAAAKRSEPPPFFLTKTGPCRALRPPKTRRAASPCASPGCLRSTVALPRPRVSRVGGFATSGGRGGVSQLRLPQQVNQELSRQLLQDGYHLDEVPDDEDLDLIPPKPAAAPCPWCFGDSLCCVLQ